jgi:hypothetical protein
MNNLCPVVPGKILDAQMGAVTKEQSGLQSQWKNQLSCGEFPGTFLAESRRSGASHSLGVAVNAGALG